MKKLLAIVLTLITLFSVFALAGCSGETETEAETLKFGLGVVSYLNAPKNATADGDGSADAVNTTAAVLVDKNGKIVKCVIDSADFTLNFTAKGEAVKVEEFKTKREKGDDYGMVAYGGAKKEWYAQADAFAEITVGKTAEEVKALVAGEGKGNDEVVKAGCTITVSDFALAVEKAVKNAKDSKATKDDTIALGIVSAQTVQNATADAAGKNEVETTVSAIAKDKDGKVTAAVTDAYQTTLNFDAKGVAAVTEKADIATKAEKGADYGMVAYGGAKKEWFEQANAFDAELIGKNSDEIAALATSEGKPVDALVTAGCTIAVSNMVKAAVKAVK